MYLRVSQKKQNKNVHQRGQACGQKQAISQRWTNGGHGPLFSIPKTAKILINQWLEELQFLYAMSVETLIFIITTLHLQSLANADISRFSWKPNHFLSFIITCNCI
jgi:hypothetical protein